MVRALGSVRPNRRTGELICTICSLQETDRGSQIVWCEHTESAVELGQDSEMIWDDHEEDLPEFQMVVVPIFPDYNCWGKVRLHTLVPGPAYTIEYRPETIETGAPVSFLGFLNEGEGRKVLRDMLLAHAYPAFEKLTCMSTFHKFRQQMEWEKALRERKMSVIYKWSVFDTGSCPPCRTTGSDLDEDDLIPDAGGARPHPLSRGGTGSRRTPARPRSFSGVSAVTSSPNNHLLHVHFTSPRMYGRGSSIDFPLTTQPNSYLKAMLESMGMEVFPIHEKVLGILHGS